MSVHHLQTMGRLGEDETELRRAIQDDPLSVPPRMYLGQCLFFSDKYPEAETALRQLLEIDERFATAYSLLATLRFLRGQLNEALEYSEKAYSLEPWARWASGQYAGFLMTNGETDRPAK